MNHNNSPKHPERPLPRKLRQDVERVTGEELPEDFTYDEAIMLMRVHEAVAKLEATREAREAFEGKVTQRAASTVEPHAEPDSKEDMKKKLWAWFAETEYERCKLFNMPVPEDTIEAAKKLGVPLELPPCQQEQGQNTKETRNEQGKPEAPSEGEGERDKPSRNGNEAKN